MRQYYAALCRDNFWAFCNICLRFDRFPWFTEEIHKPLCDWFQDQAMDWLEKRRRGENLQKYIAILVPRRAGKTTVVTQAGLLWLHLQDPDISTYIGSEKGELASVILQPVKTTISGEDPFSRFTWLYGNWYNKNRQWKTDFIIHGARHNMSKKEPSFGTWGVESGLTGKHPDVLCLDDPITYEKLATHTNWLETVNSHISALFPVMQSDGLFIAVGTRYSEGDHFGKAIRTDGIRSWSGMRRATVNVTETGLWDMFYMSGKNALGEPTMPHIWSKEQMDHYEANDPLKAAAQVYNDPASSKFNPLTRAQLLKCMIGKESVPRSLRIWFHCDVAFKKQSTQARGDLTCVVVVGHARDGSGKVYVLDIMASRIWRAEDFLKVLVDLMKYYKARGYEIGGITDDRETGGHDGSWELNLRNAFTKEKLYLPRFIPLTRSVKEKKTVRHYQAAAHIVDGRAFFRNDIAVDLLDSLIEQLTNIGNNFQDDIVDAFADTFHPECYVPAAMYTEKPEPRPQSVMESILGNTITSEVIVQYYDMLYAPPGEDTPRPIEEW